MSEFAKVPAKLCQLEQWVVWKYEQRDGKPTKAPNTVGGRLGVQH